MGGGNPIEGLAEGVPEVIDGAESLASEGGFDLREGLFDGVEVGAVGRQVEGVGVAGGEERSDAGELMGAEVVHDDEVAGPEGGQQNLTEVGFEVGPGEGAVDNHRGAEAGEAEAAEEGGRFPVTVRDGIDHPLADRSPAIEAGHRRRAEGLVEEDEATRVDPRLDDLPFRPFEDDVRPVAFGGPEGLFLSERPRARRAFQIAQIDSVRPRSRFSSTRVVPGCSATRA